MGQGSLTIIAQDAHVTYQLLHLKQRELHEHVDGVRGVDDGSCGGVVAVEEQVEQALLVRRSARLQRLHCNQQTEMSIKTWT
jgi:hypothetical protein